MIPGPPLNAGPGDDQRWRVEVERRYSEAIIQRVWDIPKWVDRFSPPAKAVTFVTVTLFPPPPEPESPKRRELDLSPVREIGTPPIVPRKIEL